MRSQNSRKDPENSHKYEEKKRKEKIYLILSIYININHLMKVTEDSKSKKEKKILTQIKEVQIFIYNIYNLKSSSSSSSCLDAINEPKTKPCLLAN